MLTRCSGVVSTTRLLILPAAGFLVLAAACSGDHSATSPQVQPPSPEVAAMLSDGFATSTAGFSQTDNSYIATGDLFAGFTPRGWGMSFGMFNRGSDLMGGGLGADFDGAGPFFDLGHVEFGGGPFAPRDAKNCTFSSTTGRITCPTVTIGGLTITRSFAYTDASGKAQSARDTTTNTVNTQSSVTGTIVTRDKRDTTTVTSSSDRTVSGLVKSSTKRTVNGKSGGTEVTVGLTRDSVKFKTTRMQGDTTVGLTIPVTNGRTSYPTAGSVTRSMKVVVQVTGKPDATSLRREVITYDGSTTAKVVITHDGTTKNCTLPLPHGRLSCPST
jgi:hypothetical protein